MSAIGRITKEQDGYQVVLERRFPVSVSKLWNAITDPKIMTLWFMDVSLELKAGGRMEFRWNDEAKTVMTGKVVRVEHEKVFEYLWENEDGPDECALWEVSADGPSGSILKLTYSRVSDKYGVSVAAGWHTYLDHLLEVLNGRTTPFPPYTGETPAMAELKKLYQQQLG